MRRRLAVHMQSQPPPPSGAFFCPSLTREDGQPKRVGDLEALVRQRRKLVDVAAALLAEHRHEARVALLEDLFCSWRRLGWTTGR